MLAILGLLTLLILFVVILTKRMAVLTALIIVPTVLAVIGGFGLNVGTFIVNGVKNIAPVAGMFIFAILFFGIMEDAGMLDPIIERILKTVGAKPTRIIMGSALLALIIHLDGSGAVCFLITIPAMLPLYEKLGMDKRILCCVASLATGVNFLPWTGPTMRASAVFGLSPTDMFNPMIPVQIVGLVFVFVVAYLLGKKEERRLGLSNEIAVDYVYKRELKPEEEALRRPQNFIINILVTIVVMGVLVTGKVQPVVMFMIGMVAALLINYPDPAMQRARIDAHAKAALQMAGILFGAGALTGILTGSGMLMAMAKTAVSFVPAGLASHIPVAMAIIGVPLTLIIDIDSFYFGIMPVLAEVLKTMGIPPIQLAQASFLVWSGFPITPLTPSPFLLVGLAGIELADHQKYTGPFLFAAVVVMTITAVIIGIFPL